MIKLELATPNIEVNFSSTDKEDSLGTLKHLSDFLDFVQYHDNVNLIVRSKEEKEEKSD